jgi:hypothetical protein
MILEPRAGARRGRRKFQQILFIGAHAATASRSATQTT